MFDEKPFGFAPGELDSLRLVRHDMTGEIESITPHPSDPFVTIRFVGHDQEEVVVDPFTADLLSVGDNVHLWKTMPEWTADMADMHETIFRLSCATEKAKRRSKKSVLDAQVGYWELAQFLHKKKYGRWIIERV